MYCKVKSRNLKNDCSIEDKICTQPQVKLDSSWAEET
ncbi:hypothetical protein T4D_4055 [Trichinella pseudospiralis]|uniref:Uncharacterized protein n=1 Tax=Trichinella pseudospiralis TaxID=6337 RepID=A0A0V1DSH7_TRIPS|nr:hypothetical protein T4D_4055 [Trichinella pseudospiralis]